MKPIYAIITLFFVFSFSFAQNDVNANGTIKVEKKDLVVQIMYDNVNYRIVGIDQYGNVVDTAITQFEMNTTIKGIAYSEKAVGNALSPKMKEIIGRCDSECSIFFTNVIVKDKNNNLFTAKPYTYTFGKKMEGTNAE